MESSCRPSRLVVGTTGCEGRCLSSSIHASAYNPTLLSLHSRWSSRVYSRSEKKVCVEGSLPLRRELTPVMLSSDPSYE